MHYGRYGRGAEDWRMVPLTIGSPGLMRGYDIDSIDNSEGGESRSMYGPLPTDVALFADTGVAWSLRERRHRL